MKICPGCNQELSLEKFAWRNKEKGTRHSSCHECRKAIAKASYQKNKDKIKAKALLRGIENREQAMRWKSTLSCVCCSESYTKCLDFHHIDPTTKEYDVSGLIGSYHLRSVLKEASKCIVVCANCHRKIHDNAIEVTQDLIDKSMHMINISVKNNSP